VFYDELYPLTKSKWRIEKRRLRSIFMLNAVSPSDWLDYQNYDVMRVTQLKYYMYQENEY
jgi:hypothetical protein